MLTDWSSWPQEGDEHDENPVSCVIMSAFVSETSDCAGGEPQQRIGKTLRFLPPPRHPLLFSSSRCWLASCRNKRATPTNTPLPHSRSLSSRGQGAAGGAESEGEIVCPRTTSRRWQRPWRGPRVPRQSGRRPQPRTVRTATRRCRPPRRVWFPFGFDFDWLATNIDHR
jgi:hypothetical protein